MSPVYIWTVSPGWLAHVGEYQDPGVDFLAEDSGRTSTHTFRLKYALDMKICMMTDVCICTCSMNQNKQYYCTTVPCQTKQYVLCI
jgi:hypothetical protein